MTLNKGPDWHSLIQTWRENLVGIAKVSEPWIAARVRAHHDAGADHVCLHVLGGPGTGPGAPEALPLGAWRRLAPALTGA